MAQFWVDAKIFLANSFFVEKEVLYMNFKRMLCGLVSVSIFLGSTVSALPMKEIFKDKSFATGTEVTEHISKLQKYIKEETARIESIPLRDERDRQLLRMDSIVFGLFCCFCYKKNWTNYISEVSKKRNPAEREEDSNVINSIFPNNFEKSFDGADGLKQLCMRLGIDVNDIIMSRVDFLGLDRFICGTPTLGV